MTSLTKRILSASPGTWSSLILLIGSFGLVLIVPLFPLDIASILFILFYAIILIAAIYALNGNVPFRFAVVLIIILQLVGFFFEFDTLFDGVTLLTIAMFTWVVVKLVIEIVRKKTVTGEVLLDSVSVYMLMGIVFALFGNIIFNAIPGAYSPGDEMNMRDMFYFTFVTMTTLGYGEIVPVDPVAKSLAMFTAIAGQFYLTLVIAVLVGKYLAPD